MLSHHSHVEIACQCTSAALRNVRQKGVERERASKRQREPPHHHTDKIYRTSSKEEKPVVEILRLISFTLVSARYIKRK